MKTFYSSLRQFCFYAGYNSMERLEKTSTEVVPVAWEFKPILPDNEIVNLATSSILIMDQDGLDVTSSLANALSLQDDTRLKTSLKTGTSGIDYVVKFIGRTNPNNYRLEGLLLLQIRDHELDT